MDAAKESKRCSSPLCEQENPQPISNFGKNKKGKGGLYCHCKPCHRLQGRNRYNKPGGREAKHRDQVRKYWPHLSRDEAYVEYKKLETKQNNLCDICAKFETEVDKKFSKVKYLNVDHCHKTGKVRALLCGKCNRGIGQLQDCPDICTKAANYLKKHSVSNK